MDLSFQSIKNILINNQLIRGRLDLTPQKIQSLYIARQKQNKKIQNELDKETEKNKLSLHKIRDLKLKLRKCEETVKKAFFPSTTNIALLYKKVGTKYYIKGRFYWLGQQREVQIGSIPIVLETIKIMLQKGYIQDCVLPNKNTITWDQFKKNDLIILATKEIAALKFQEYVIRKLINNEEILREKVIDEKNLKISSSAKTTEPFSDNEKYGWYEKWGKENL